MCFFGIDTQSQGTKAFGKISIVIIQSWKIKYNMHIITPNSEVSLFLLPVVKLNFKMLTFFAFLKNQST